MFTTLRERLSGRQAEREALGPEQRALVEKAEAAVRDPELASWKGEVVPNLGVVMEANLWDEGLGIKYQLLFGQANVVFQRNGVTEFELGKLALVPEECVNSPLAKTLVGNRLAEIAEGLPYSRAGGQHFPIDWSFSRKKCAA